MQMQSLVPSSGEKDTFAVVGEEQKVYQSQTCPGDFPAVAKDLAWATDPPET